MCISILGHQVQEVKLTSDARSAPDKAELGEFGEITIAEEMHHSLRNKFFP